MSSIFRIVFLTAFLTFIAGFISSCENDGDGGATIPGMNGPHLIVTETHVIFSTVFYGIPLDVGGRYMIPESKSSYVELSPDFESSGTLLVAALSKEDMADGGINMEDRGIPGSYFRPIPDAPGGKLPAISFQIPKFPHMPYIVLYIGEERFGYFYPLPLEVMGDVVLSWPYKSGSEKLGMTYVVGKGINPIPPGPQPGPMPTGEPSGYLFLLNKEDVGYLK